MIDKLTETYSDLIEGSYDCPDRIVLNAYFSLIIQCRSEERKHLIAQQHLPQDPEFSGLFLVLVSRASGLVWDVTHTVDGRIQNLSKQYRFVNHYFFHIINPVWGHVTVRMSAHPPFGAQVILNGHEYVDRQARRLGVKFSKEGNCFTDIIGMADDGHLAVTSRPSGAIRRGRYDDYYSAFFGICIASCVAHLSKNGMGLKLRLRFSYDLSRYS